MYVHMYTYIHTYLYDSEMQGYVSSLHLLRANLVYYNYGVIRTYVHTDYILVCTVCTTSLCFSTALRRRIAACA